MFKNRHFMKKSTILFMLLALLTSSHLYAENRIFNKVCESCHTGGFKGWLSGAPNVEKKSNWQEYIERDSIERMQEIVIKGSDDHKVKGGCKRCTDEQVIETIDYMMSLVK